MADPRGFLDAICASPEDDTPRLIFADWLEENGQPERAEFIRVQIELARLPGHSERKGELQGRANALLKRNRQAWLRDLPAKLRRPGQTHFVRGFVHGLACTLAVFLQAAPAVFRSAPVRRVWLSHHQGAPALWDELSECPSLTHLRELCLGHSGIGDAGVIALAASPYLVELTHLHLGSNQLTDAAARALLTSPYRSHLALLDLQRNAFGEACKQALRLYFGERVRLD